MDIFRPDNALDTAKLFLNWDGMGKLMLERYYSKIKVICPGMFWTFNNDAEKIPK